VRFLLILLRCNLFRNYAPSISPQAYAASKGFSQVLFSFSCSIIRLIRFIQVMWLFGDNLEITEVGTMNLFFLWVNTEGLPTLDVTNVAVQAIRVSNCR
jgi:branched-subunit amino acid aminotransferase/4-amino-4-deoxychorismate lyase